jgi:hypothetical protein
MCGINHNECNGIFAHTLYIEVWAYTMYAVLVVLDIQ